MTTELSPSEQLVFDSFIEIIQKANELIDVSLGGVPVSARAIAKNIHFNDNSADEVIIYAPLRALVRQGLLDVDYRENYTLTLKGMEFM